MNIMLRLIAFSPLVVFLLCNDSSIANAASVLDQQQPSVDFGSGYISIGGNSGQRLSQVVTAGITGDLVAVAFPFGLSEAGGNLLVSINSTNGRVPTDDVFASQLVAPATIPPFEEGPLFRSIEFSFPAFFNAGDEFAIVLECEAPGANQCFAETSELAEKALCSSGVFAGPGRNRDGIQ